MWKGDTQVFFPPTSVESLQQWLLSLPVLVEAALLLFPLSIPCYDCSLLCAVSTTIVVVISLSP